MVKFGLTPLQALQASVINSPLTCTKPTMALSLPAKKADILLLDANPVADIHNTQKIIRPRSKEANSSTDPHSTACWSK